MNAYGLFLFFLLLFPEVTVCTSRDTIAINQTIKDGDVVISKGKKFALGFFSPGRSRYRYLGIWYHKIPQLTAVWIANRDNPINDSSGVLSLDHNGNLVLFGSHGLVVPVWSSNVSDEVANTWVAQLLDSGNLVLVQERSKKILWQSFDYPTNTILEGMKLGLNRRTGLEMSITSWRSPDDPGTGNYLLKLNQSSSPQPIIYKGTSIHYRGIPWPWKQYIKEYSHYFVNNDEELYLTYFIHNASSIIRLVLDDSGFVKWLIWQDDDVQWQQFGIMPANQCELYGKCGAYGKCDPYHINGIDCACLPGYEPRFPQGWYSKSRGCVRKRLASSSVCGHGEGFVHVANVKLPDVALAVWLSMSMSRADCETECLRNCSCTAYASLEIPGNETGCLAWYGQLMDTANQINDGTDFYVRVDALELAEYARKSNGILELKGPVAILVLSVASAWLALIIFACFWIRNRKKKGKKKLNKRVVSDLDHYQDTLPAKVIGGGRVHPDYILFDRGTILAATNNFSQANKLGQGGFGSVYKGQLSNGLEIAVKRLSKSSGQGVEEFTNEVVLIAKLQHRNLVKLLGCCIEGEEPMLVYEYMPNRSLDSFLFDDTKKSLLDWSKRFSIIVGVARGVLYLHQDSRLRIIHRDLKSSNILLDAEMNPKISDFGMARLCKDDQIQGNTNRVVGTYGYMSPEYALFGKFSVKSDVFSFGIVLLEIISGKKNSYFYSPDSPLSLMEHVWQYWSEGRALEIVDSSLKESSQSQDVLRCIQIGLLCVQADAKDRPTMLTVVSLLTGETSLPSPKQPAFIIKKHASNPGSKLEEEEQCSINEFWGNFLEIISGKKNADSYSEDPFLSLIGQVWRLWIEGRALDTVDPSLEESYLCQEVLRCIRIGLL